MVVQIKLTRATLRRKQMHNKQMFDLETEGEGHGVQHLQR